MPANTANVSSVLFALNYDNACLTFDSVTDSNNDGIPDSMTKRYSGSTGDFVTYGIWHYDIDSDSADEIVIMMRTYQWDGSKMRAIPLSREGGVLTDLTFDLVETCRTDDGSSVDVDFSFYVKTSNPRIPSISDLNGKSLAKPPGDHVDPGTYTLQFNGTPKNIYFDSAPPLTKGIDFDEAQPAGTAVGTLVNDDDDLGDTHTYKLVDTCLEANDNYAFSISGDQLLSKAPFDFEDDVVLGPDKSFSVCVQVTDKYDASHVELLTVHRERRQRTGHGHQTGQHAHIRA